MKKFCGFLIMLLIALAPIVFSACGNKYNNLSMGFYNMSGEKITSVNLVINNADPENDKDTIRLAVRFDGISTGDIGNTAITSQSADLVTVSNTLLSGNMYYADILANKPGKGKLVVTHLSSNKSYSIDLIVEQKSNNLTLKNSSINTYVMSIPETGSRTANIVSSELLSLQPYGSTDAIYFVKADNKNLNSVTPQTVEVNGAQLISGFTIGSGAENNGYITLHPVTTMQNFENKVYENITIKVVFAKTLSDENIVLKSSETYQDFISNNEEIVLITNANYNDADSKLGSFPIWLECVDDQLSMLNYLDYTTNGYGYTYILDEYEYVELVEIEKNEIRVQSKPNVVSRGAFNVIIGLEPKNCVGEISAIKKQVKVRCEISPDTIEVFKQNQKLGAEDNVVDAGSLYDFYANSLGALFNFSPIPDYSYADLRFVRLKVDASMLNAHFTGEEGEGVNEIEASETQKQELASKIRTNGYLLQIYLNSRPMKFSFDGEMLVSEPFSYQDRVHIKSNLVGDPKENLYLIAETCYNSEGRYEYLNALSSANVRVNFEYKTGVSELRIEAGNLKKEGSAISPNTVEGKLANDNSVYLNRLNGNNRPVDGSTTNGAYILMPLALNEGAPVNNAEISVNVRGGNANPLKIKQYNNSVDYLGLGSAILESASTTISYKYSYNSGNNNYIILVFDENTDIGRYEIAFSQENGTEETVVVCYIYQDIEDKDVSFALDLEELGGRAFENKDADGNKFANYTADYIVPKQNSNFDYLDLNLLIGNEFTSTNIIKEYNFDKSFAEGVEEDVDDFIQVQVLGSYARLTFKKGTYFNSQNNDITITMSVVVSTFENILTPSSTEFKTISKSITLFIYEELTDSQISLNAETLTRYFYESLGAMDKDLGEAELEVTLADANLWNYVQPSNENKVDWGIAVLGIEKDQVPTYITSINQTNNSIKVRFGGVGEDMPYSVVTINAQIRQFNKVLNSNICRIYVYEPIFTDRLTVDGYNEVIGEGDPTFVSGLKIRNTNNAGHYINIKVGADQSAKYELQINNISNGGVVTNPGVFMLVADSNGNVDRSVVQIQNNVLTVNGNNIRQSANLKIYIFARDVLKEDLSSAGAITNIQSYLKDGHKNAYLVIDLMFSNGSKENPYLVTNEAEFWEMQTYPDRHFKLMTNINITRRDIIENFTGSLVSDSEGSTNYIYSVTGIELNNSAKNLFEEVNGEISNVNFVVNYNYNINADSTLGLIGVNNGTLENVTITMSGKSTFSGGSVNFGALAGINNNTIKYTSNSIIGVNGNINLSGSALTNFGALVGVNNGNILGYDKTTGIALNANYAVLAEINNEDVIFNVSINGAGAISSAEIDATELTNTDSAVGGVVGQNLGVIKNAYTTGSIKGCYNVGGIVGKNECENAIELNFTITRGNLTVLELNGSSYDDFAISNSTSSMDVQGTYNVGGIVGHDINGSFYNVHYQILEAGSGVSGTENVGGIAGYSNSGVFAFCSVMSYRWDYSNLATNDFDSADISAENYVSGIVGFASNGVESLDGSGVIQTTAILYSSVNAYIVGNSNFAGIISNNAEDDNLSIFFNGYFMGAINKEVITSPETSPELIHTVLANEEKTVFNKVYAKYINNNKEETEISNFDQASFGITYDSMQGVDYTNWGGNEAINGGYIYISLNNNEPIFEVSPTDLTAQAKNDYALFNEGTKIQNALHLYYYDFDLSPLDPNYEDYLQHQTTKNTYKILDLFEEFKLNPEFSQQRLNVSSSNPNILAISIDKIIINNVGTCSLTFTSPLNRNLSKTIHIVIDYPFGDSFAISESAMEKTFANNATINIAKGSAKQFYVLTSGKLQGEDNLTEFNYITNNSVNLKLDLKIITKEGVEQLNEETVKYLKHLTISGQNFTYTTAEDGTITINSIYIDKDTPFNISITEKLDDYMFEITISPYLEVEIEVLKVKVFGKYADLISTFKIGTFAGATNVSMTLEDVILYPEDHTSLTVYIDTDLKLEENELLGLINKEQTQNEFVKLDFKLIDNKYIGTENRQIAVFDVRIVKLKDFTDEQNLIVNLNLKQGDLIIKSVSSTITILPQRIDNIEIKNYLYELDGNAVKKDENDNAIITLSNVLRPSHEGLIILDMVPDSGYYDYLEITDITGSEEINFYQITGVNGSRINTMEPPSSDGKGIKLFRQGDVTRLYVATRIDASAVSRLHTISVRAYHNSGAPLSEPKTYVINMRMLPSIIINYVEPNGKVTANTSEKQFYIANGVDAEFRIDTRNADEGAVEVKLSDTDNFTIVQSANNPNFYTLKFKTVDSALIGKTVTITATTRATQANNQFDTATDTITLNIMPFVVHGISVTSSRTATGSENKEIYGNFGVETNLEFYFAPNDISIYNNGFHNQTYRISDNYRPSNLVGVYNMLETINTNNSNAYLKLDKNENSNITLTGNKLLVNSIYASDKLILKFYLKLEENNWQIAPTVEDGYTYMEYEYTYNLSFNDVAPFLQPDVIKNEEDFLNMASGDRAYILGNDLNLYQYTPMEVNFNLFDGNGRKIIIHSFAPFNDADVLIGLFKEIPEGMVVMNLEVIYVTEDDEDGYTLGSVTTNSGNRFNVSYKEICANTDINYNSVNFGGIAPTNNGIITNCKVSGYVALSAKPLEDSAGATINFNMGGVCASNNGYITNSASHLGMFAMANIGGLVYSNNNGGKIVSSVFDASESFNTYREVKNYTYNSSSSATNSVLINSTGAIYANRDIEKEIEVGGFAVLNSGEISMSYVTVGYTTINTTQLENALSRYQFAGFVYNNSSVVKDCYSQFETIGHNPNYFNGFVVDNGGTISTSYSNINSGVHSDWLIINMFAPSTVGGTIQDCYEINEEKENDQSPKIEGVTRISYLEAFDKSSFTNFLFGNNISSVWTINNSMPELVACLEKAEYTEDKPSDDDYFYGLRRIKIIENSSTNEDGTITKNYIYQTLDNGYGNKQNPIVIYDLKTYNTYFAEENANFYNKYFRFVTDIDFTSVRENPLTSTVTFGGNIQGNNMSINNLMLYSPEDLSSIGLFKNLSGTYSADIENAVRNLTINFYSINAVHTQAVGTLAGIIENFNLYNISVNAVNSNNSVVQGGNAVGGLAGIIRGEFDMENISSTVGAFSNYQFNRYSYGVYLSKNNGLSAGENNLHDANKEYSLFYAGSVAGIVDGYDYSNYSISNNRNIDADKYFELRNITVSGSIAVSGETVGSAFGLIGERVKLINGQVNLTGGNLSGKQYSGGLVGENRGVIQDSSIIIEPDMFANSTYVSAGVVGFNLGGLILNTNASLNINKTTNNTTVGGIVGRNLNGFVKDCYFSGELLGSFTGGLIGADYTKNTLTNASNGAGVLYADCHTALPDSVTYIYTEDEIENIIANEITNSSISKETLNYFFNNLNKFYGYKHSETEYFSALNYIRVLGLAVGLFDHEMDLIYGLDTANESLTFNGQVSIDGVSKLGEASLYDGAELNLPYMNYILMDTDKNYVMYALGAETENFNSWMHDSYSSDMVAFINSGTAKTELQIVDGTSSEPIKFKIFVTGASGESAYKIKLLSDAGGESLTLKFTVTEDILNLFKIDEENIVSVSVNGEEYKPSEDFKLQASGVIMGAVFIENECSIQFSGKSIAEDGGTITSKFTFTLTD